jgi:hypothetical protein
MADNPDYGNLQTPSGGYGQSQNAPSPYNNAPVRVAQRDPAPPKKKVNKEPRTKKPEWKPTKDGPHRPTTRIYILFYFSYISKTFTFDEFLQRLHGSNDPDRWPETSPFIQDSIDIVKQSNSDTVWTDLGNALNEPGAVVVYWGHSERLKKSNKARNLRPRPDPDDAASDITVGQLKMLLDIANAKSFILASCATDGCIGKGKRDTAIIATDSGKDLLTNTIDWTNALEPFLKSFITGSPITDCVSDANKSFAKSSDSDDKFVLASGVGALTVKS